MLGLDNDAECVTSPFPSASKMSMTRCTSGFCCSSGRDMNSSMDSAPELSKSNLRNLLPSRRISSASTAYTHTLSGTSLEGPAGRRQANHETLAHRYVYIHNTHCSSNIYLHTYFIHFCLCVIWIICHLLY